MDCPKCGFKHSHVHESRKRANSVYRRRVCGGCQFRYTTFEVSDETMHEYLTYKGIIARFRRILTSYNPEEDDSHDIV